MGQLNLKGPLNLVGTLKLEGKVMVDGQEALVVAGNLGSATMTDPKPTPPVTMTVPIGITSCANTTVTAGGKALATVGAVIGDAKALGALSGAATTVNAAGVPVCALGSPAPIPLTGTAGAGTGTLTKSGQ